MSKYTDLEKRFFDLFKAMIDVYTPVVKAEFVKIFFEVDQILEKAQVKGTNTFDSICGCYYDNDTFDTCFLHHLKKEFQNYGIVPPSL